MENSFEKNLVELIYIREKIQYKKGKPRIPPESSDPVSAFVACFFKNYGFPLMTTLMLMLVMVITMRMLMTMLFY